MEEYVTEAIVLRKTSFKQVDARYTLFTKRFGKMVAKAISSRKITSKLAGHLEPGTRVRVRLIEKNGLVLVDALKDGVVDSAISLQDLYFLDRVLPENEEESSLWSLIENGKFNWREVLSILGWDPEEATCYVCGQPHPRGFSLARQEFLCANCVGRFHPQEVLIELVSK
jgi:DNA repair protein RecO (recombination protein O)